MNIAGIVTEMIQRLFSSTRSGARMPAMLQGDPNDRLGRAKHGPSDAIFHTTDERGHQGRQSQNHERLRVGAAANGGRDSDRQERPGKRRNWQLAARCRCVAEKPTLPRRERRRRTVRSPGCASRCSAWTVPMTSAAGEVVSNMAATRRARRAPSGSEAAMPGGTPQLRARSKIARIEAIVASMADGGSGHSLSRAPRARAGPTKSEESRSYSRARRERSFSKARHASMRWRACSGQGSRERRPSRCGV